MAQKRLPNQTFEDARIIWKNFAGAEKQFNEAGDRNFNLVLSPEDAEAMRNDGWNVKTRPPREEGDDPIHVLKVKVSYKGRPPRAVLITSRGRTNLDESTIEMIDYADIEKVDLIINPFHWNIRGEDGVTAYLHAIYVTIREDYLELKYADVPEIGSNERLAIEADPSNPFGFEDMGEIVDEPRALER